MCSTYLVCGNIKSQGKIDEDFKLWKESKLETIVHHIKYQERVTKKKTTTLSNERETIDNGKKKLHEHIEKFANRYIANIDKPGSTQDKHGSKDKSRQAARQKFNEHTERIIIENNNSKGGKSNGPSREIQEHSMKQLNRHVGDTHQTIKDVPLFQSSMDVNEHLIKHADRHIDGVEDGIKNNDTKEHIIKHIQRHIDNKGEVGNDNIKSADYSLNLRGDVSSEEKFNHQKQTNKGISLPYFNHACYTQNLIYKYIG